MKRFKVPEFDIKGIDIYINLKQLLSEQGEAKTISDTRIAHRN